MEIFTVSFLLVVAGVVTLVTLLSIARSHRKLAISNLDVMLITSCLCGFVILDFMSLGNSQGWWTLEVYPVLAFVARTTRIILYSSMVWIIGGAARRQRKAEELLEERAEDWTG